jgi:formylmethanofuran dehydrogenase subunit E
MAVPDNYSQWEAHQREYDSWLAKRPVCADCGEHIQDEEAYYISGAWICVDCMDSYRREVLPE